MNHYAVRATLADGTYLWFGYTNGARDLLKEVDDPRVCQCYTQEQADFLQGRVWEGHGLKHRFNKVETCVVATVAYPL